MNILIRADASINIGTGHVMRCLTLAEQITTYSNETMIYFACRELDGNMMSHIESKGYRVLPLSCGKASQESEAFCWERDQTQLIDMLKSYAIKFDWLVVDHYQIDVQWEKSLRPYVKGIAVIDDLANRYHDCDILLDQNEFFNTHVRYENKIPPHCVQLLGPQNVLLRSQFYDVLLNEKVTHGSVKRIFIFFGGSDPTNETLKTLKAFELFGSELLQLEVVVGASNPNKDKVKAYCQKLNHANFYCQIENIAEIMATCDLSIGAGGTALWERCFLGLPSLTIACADNQVETVAALTDKNVIWNIGWHEEVSVKDISDYLRLAIASPSKMGELRKNAMNLMKSDVLKTSTNYVHPLVNLMFKGELKK